jgi:hypothetical protein
MNDRLLLWLKETLTHFLPRLLVFLLRILQTAIRALFLLKDYFETLTRIFLTKATLYGLIRRRQAAQHQHNLVPQIMLFF